MSLGISTIVEKVKVNMDEIAGNDASFVDEQDNTEMTTIIKQKIMEAYLYILKNAREDLLEEDVYETKIDSISGSVSGEVEKGLNSYEYLRIILVRCNGWSKAVKAEDFIEEGSDDEARVTDAVSGACAQRPAVVWIKSSGDKLQLLGTKGSTTFSIKYIAKPTVTDNFDFDLGNVLNGALINYTTGLVWVTYGEYKRAEAMFDLALSEMGVEASKIQQ